MRRTIKSITIAPSIPHTAPSISMPTSPMLVPLPINAPCNISSAKAKINEPSNATTEGIAYLPYSNLKVQINNVKKKAKAINSTECAKFLTIPCNQSTFSCWTGGSNLSKLGITICTTSWVTPCEILADCSPVRVELYNMKPTTENIQSIKNIL